MIDKPNTDAVVERWHPASSDPPHISDIELRFRNALAIVYGEGWPFYNQETRDRLGDESVRININPSCVL